MGRAAALVLGFVAAFLVSPGPVAGALDSVRPGEESSSHEDPVGDLTFCDTTETVPVELVQLDLVSVQPIVVRSGSQPLWSVTFEVRGAGNLGLEVSELRDRDPLVAVRIAREPEGDDWIELRAGRDGDTLIRSVVDPEGREVPGASLTVDEGGEGEAVFSGSGLPFGGGGAWGAFTRYEADGRLACDKLADSLSEEGAPLLPLEETGQVDAVETEVTEPKQEEQGAPATQGKNEGEDDAFPWGWAVGLGLAVGVGLVGLGLRVKRLLGRPPDCEDEKAAWEKAKKACEEARAAAEAAEADAADKEKKLEALKDAMRELCDACPPACAPESWVENPDTGERITSTDIWIERAWGAHAQREFRDDPSAEQAEKTASDWREGPSDEFRREMLARAERARARRNELEGEMDMAGDEAAQARSDAEDAANRAAEACAAADDAKRAYEACKSGAG